MPLIRHAKKRGEWVELKFMARATAQGLTVSKPWGETSKYDFVVDHKGKFLRVQVKSTVNYWRGYYICHCSPPTRETGYESHEIDFLVAYIIPEDVWFVVPVEVVRRLRRCISFGLRRQPRQRYAEYLEAWHLLKK